MEFLVEDGVVYSVEKFGTSEVKASIGREGSKYVMFEMNENTLRVTIMNDRRQKFETFNLTVPVVVNGIEFSVDVVNGVGEFDVSEFIYDGIDVDIIGNEEFISEPFKTEPLPKPPSLDDFKLNKIQELKQQCEYTIIGGYQSSVVLQSTGKVHMYPTDRDDQLNLNGTATASQLKPDVVLEFKTVDSGYVEHTSQEIQSVAYEVYEFILSNLKKVNQLAQQVMACETEEEINAIVW